MLGPTIVTGMEQGNAFPGKRIASLGSCRFAEGAGDARQREVIGVRGPLSGARPDMINMEDGFLGRLRQPAVLAAAPGPTADQSAQSCRDALTHGPRCLAANSNRSRSRDRRSTNSVRAAASRRS